MSSQFFLLHLLRSICCRPAIVQIRWEVDGSLQGVGLDAHLTGNGGYAYLSKPLYKRGRQQTLGLDFSPSPICSRCVSGFLSIPMTSFFIQRDISYVKGIAQIPYLHEKLISSKRPQACLGHQTTFLCYSSVILLWVRLNELRIRNPTLIIENPDNLRGIAWLRTRQNPRACCRGSLP